MKESCQLYLENPEAQAGHLVECADCRRMTAALDQGVDAQPLRVETLPLAPWEGASHRSWPLVLGSALAVVAIASAFFVVAGVSPLDIARLNAPSLDVLMSIMRLAGGAIKNAPMSWQVGICISFVVVNFLFFVLLRRAPRGIDA